jgi:hypothetical protein
MTLNELLKDKPEILKEVEAAIKNAGAKFVDLTEGGYVDAKKYSDLESKYKDLKEAPNPLEDKVKELEELNTSNLNAERDKLSSIIKKMAIDNEIAALGIKDELTKAGIKSLIKADDLKLNENYEVIDGLKGQIEEIRNTYKDSFVTPEPVSTGQSVKSSSTAEHVKKYTSTDLDKMTVDDVIADYQNIVSQLGTI